MTRVSYRFPQPADALRLDGERYVSGLLGEFAWGDIQSEHYHRYLFALRFCIDKDVLDIASGEGYGSYCLGQVARSVVGVDANDEAVAFANRNYRSDSVSFRAGKAQSIPVHDASIDVVVSYETLEHFNEHDAFAAEVRRVLRPGGLLVISSPNRVIYSEQADYHNEWHLRELDRGGFLEYLVTNFTHVRLFAQRPLVGSVIASDDGCVDGQAEGFILKGERSFDRTESLPEPPYFLALASDAELPDAGLSVLQNPALMEHVDAQRQQAQAFAAEMRVHTANLEAALVKVEEEKARQGAALIALQAEHGRHVTSLPPAPEPKEICPTQPEISVVGQRASDLLRLRNPAWVEPDKRPEWTSLRHFRIHAKIAVVVHIYYSELWPEMAEAVRNIPEEFDLFITLVNGVSDTLASEIRQQFPNAQVLLVDNHGRDILPFLTLLRTGILFNYELICKIHTKRSPYLEDGDAWRRLLIGGILGSVALVQKILDAFRSDADLGIVVADGQVFGGRERWISNKKRLSELFRFIGLNASAFERDFVGGSVYWIRPLILRPIDSLKLGFDAFEAEPIGGDGCTVHAIERLVSLVCYEAGMRAEESGSLAPAPPEPPGAKVHVIANYLPQFHPIPENDVWWGKGFTEWTNVTKALPLFRGHRQPRLPTDLGFCDLRLPETRQAQADLARKYGVTAFSYYYYWFNGRRLLDRPIEEVLASGEPDFPFMLCWANEPWTRNWDGLSKEILISQDYAPGWERSFAADVAPMMRDQRYLRFNDKPMLAIYRIGHIPDKIGSIVRLRDAFADQGFPSIHLMGGWLQIDRDEPLPPDPRDLGLDAYFEFPPHGIPGHALNIPVSDHPPDFGARVFDYGATVDAVVKQLATGQSGFRHRGVMMGWDNAARRGNNSYIFHGATPVSFRRWLRAALQAARSEARGAENAVFINAWNEWAEGTYLEPDSDFGTGWLEAVASATGRGVDGDHDRHAGTVCLPEIAPAPNLSNEESVQEQASALVPGAASSMSTGSAVGVALSIHLYQIAYSAATLAAVEPGYLVLDNLANERPDWREYWPIRRFLLGSRLDAEAFYGFFSTKFSAKTMLAHAQVKAFVESNSGNADVILFSPQPDMGAFYLNVFEQGETFDPGLIESYSAFLTYIGRPIPVQNLIMDSRQTVFSNYFVAKPAFWQEWLKITEALFAICEGPDSVLKQSLCRPTTYPGAIERKVFLQERAASLVLATQPQWRCLPYNPFGMAWSMTRFRDHPIEAIISDALKMGFRDVGFSQYIAAFSAVRERFIAARSPPG